MTREQLAKRIGVSAATVNTLERSEAKRTITLESLDRLAKGMGCRVVYAIVPIEERTFEALVEKQAERVARKQLARVSHTMKLENQALDPRQERRQLARLVDSLLEGSRRVLWR